LPGLNGGGAAAAVNKRQSSSSWLSAHHGCLKRTVNRQSIR